MLLSLCALAPGPTSRPLGTTRQKELDRQRVAELSRQAIHQIDQREFDRARHTLQAALLIAPDSATCLYNVACVDCALGDIDAAMDALRRATDAGFTDFVHLQNDPMLGPLHDLRGYRELLARKDEIRHHAAQRVLSQLKKDFSDHYLYQVDEAQKLAVAIAGDAAQLDELQKALAREAASQRDLVFSHPSDEFIRVIVASPVDFAGHEFRPGVSGRYDDTTRTLLVKRIGPELRHEFTHALHAADQHALFQEHPVWLSEGLATLYEEPRIAAGKMLPSDDGRLHRVQAAARHHQMIPLDKLLQMDRPTFTARAALAYGEAGSLLFYLYQHQLLKRFYDSYTEGYLQDRSGRAALESTTGMELPALAGKWEQWLLSRPTPLIPEPPERIH